MRKKLVNLGYPLNQEDYLHEDVPVPTLISQPNWYSHLSELGNKEGKRVLEIGGRAVIYGGFQPLFEKAEYVVFDYYPGENVDVVGDAHKLSSYFDVNEKFDIIFSTAVFEHLAMPWLVSVEISKLLKTGGYVFVETHFAFSLHERPWDFYRYTDMGLKALFPPALGFECIEAGLSNLIVAKYSEFVAEPFKGTTIKGLYCHSGYLGKKVRDADNFSWMDVDLENVVDGSSYPENKTNGE